MLIQLLLLLTTVLCAQSETDPRCLQFMGISLEGSIDSLNTRLTEAEFVEWGRSDDGEDFYYPTSVFYKDMFAMGLHGPVQEIVTENAVAEDQFLRFLQDGQLENPDLVNREYDRYGYLRRARMTEKQGYSDVEYAYDSRYRMIRRTLTNNVANIRYVNEYTYNDQDEIMSESQKVYDKTGACVMTINMHNSYLTRDDYGNWTTNSLTLSYWEEGSQSQQTTVLQKRVIEYWEE